MAKIGDKVVCVDASGSDHILKQNTIYTISDIVACPRCKGVNYRLVEINDTFGSAGTACRKCYAIISIGYCVFKASRFRPVSYPNLSFKEIAKEEVVESLDVPVKQLEEA